LNEWEFVFFRDRGSSEEIWDTESGAYGQGEVSLRAGDFWCI